MLRRLSDGARTLLAVRRDEVEGNALVVMRQLELPEVLALEARNHAEWAMRFSHPHLARVFDCELGDEGAFWVTELSSGATMAELHGAGAAHGMVRDQSVAVSLDGSARLLDTGLFRCLAQGPTWLEARELMGPYFAPEQLLEGRLPNPKTDVYSLGVVLYEGLTGELVRRGKTFEQQVKLARAGSLVPASRLNVAVGAALDEVLQRALSADRSVRYPTAREFASALSDAASAFMWRRELRGQFIARHFEERRRQDEALKELLARTPAPQPEVVAAVEHLEAAPVLPLPRLIQQAPPLLARPVVLAPAPVRRSRAGPLAAVCGVALGLGAALFLPVLPVAAPPAPVVVLQAPAAPEVQAPFEGTEALVVTLEPVVAFTQGLSSNEAPVEERLQTPDAAPSRKVKRAVRRAKDTVPMPPWLMKRSRR